LASRILRYKGHAYTVADDPARGIVLFKASKYDTTQSRKDDKGRTWTFNGETRRWRLHREEGSSSPASDKKKPAQAADPSTKQASKSGVSRRIGNALKASGGAAHIDALHDLVGAKTGIGKDELQAHVQGLVKRGKLFDHGGGVFGRSPKPESDVATETPKGGAISTQRSALALRSKTQEKKAASNPVDAVSERYASDNPSDSDVSGWIQDVAIASTAPNPAADQSATLRHQSLISGLNPSKIKTREGWAKAAYAKEQQGKKARGGQEFTAESFSFWGSRQEEQLNAAQKKANNPKATEQGRQKAAKLAEKLAAQKEEDLKDAQATADRMNTERGGDRKTRIAALLKEFDQHAESLASKRQSLHEKVKKGDKRAVAQAAHDVIKEMDHYTPTAGRGGKERGDREAVRTHLQTFHSKNGGDAKILGMPSGGDFTMQELKSAYRRAASAAHPDAGGSEKAFQAVNDAYQRLKGQAKLSKAMHWRGHIYNSYWHGDRVILRRAI